MGSHGIFGGVLSVHASVCFTLNSIMYCSCGNAAICKAVEPLLLPHTTHVGKNQQDVFAKMVCPAQPTSAPLSFSGRDSHTVKVMVLSGSKTL